MPHLELIVSVKLKVKLSVYFVTSVLIFSFNIVSTKLQHKNENRPIYFDAFDFKITQRERHFMSGLNIIVKYDAIYKINFITFSIPAKLSYSTNERRTCNKGGWVFKEILAHQLEWRPESQKWCPRYTLV